MRLATWNVNSVNARLETVRAWFEENDPDVACLQEIKCVDEKFPRETFESLGYNVETYGQKAYNGVAILSKYPLEDVRRGLPDGEISENDPQSRYIEAVVAAPRPVRVASIYAPNGNPITTDKFAYKLAWMDRLHSHAGGLLALEEALVLAGDFNVIPAADDCYDAAAWGGDALFQPQTHAAFRSLEHLGFVDAHAAIAPDPHAWTFWDYQAGAWQRDLGIRIDFALLSPQAADRLVASVADKSARAREKPSDHVPVVVTLD